MATCEWCDRELAGSAPCASRTFGVDGVVCSLSLPGTRMRDHPRSDRGATPGAVAPEWRYGGTVPSIQVKDVPDDVHATLRRRAAAAGQSLQEYLLARLTDAARTPTLDEVLDRAGGRAGGRAPLDAAARAVRADRDAR